MSLPHPSHRKGRWFSWDSPLRNSSVELLITYNEYDIFFSFRPERSQTIPGKVPKHEVPLHFIFSFFTKDPLVYHYNDEWVLFYRFFLGLLGVFLLGTINPFC